MMSNSEILIIGGSGSLGKVLTRTIMNNCSFKGIRIYSRDEYKHWIMKQEFHSIGNISYLIGDICDKERLMLAMRGVDLVVNCAAMKQVPACEENPINAVQTNVLGINNLVYCAVQNNVKRVMHISTDKAVYPINLYGMTKGVGEKIIIHSNTYNPERTTFACCRYGNVLASRGSIVPVVLKAKETGEDLKITNKNMTRFWITLEKVAKFIINRINDMSGGDIFVPKMPSMKIIDMMKALAPNNKIKNVGIRNGEKLHECLITTEEQEHVQVFDKYYRINNFYGDYSRIGMEPYTSLNNEKWINGDQLKTILNHTKIYKI